MESKQTNPRPFHLAIPTNDLAKSKKFYGEILGCPQGRTDPEKWIDYNFFGNQLVAHFATSAYTPQSQVIDNFPVPYFGVNLTKETIDELKVKLDKASHPFKLIQNNSGKGEVIHVQDLTGNNLIFT